MSDPTHPPTTHRGTTPLVIASGLFILSSVLLMAHLAGVFTGRWDGLTWIWWAGVAFLAVGAAITILELWGAR